MTAIAAGEKTARDTRLDAPALADTRVVVVNGARQVGKSTLAELMAASARERSADTVVSVWPMTLRAICR
jgi:predicted AAA+ superfamily ATPase